MRGRSSGVVQCPGADFDEPGEPLVHRPVVLGQDVDAQTALDEGGDHLAGAVVPLVGARAGQRSVSVGAGLFRFVDEGLGLLEVGVGEQRRLIGQ